MLKNLSKSHPKSTRYRLAECERESWDTLYFESQATLPPSRRLLGGEGVFRKNTVVLWLVYNPVSLPQCISPWETVSSAYGLVVFQTIRGQRTGTGMRIIGRISELPTAWRLTIGRQTSVFLEDPLPLYLKGSPSPRFRPLIGGIRNWEARRKTENGV